MDVKPFEGRPCELLKPEQVASLTKAKPPKPGDSILGPECSWRGADTVRDTSINVGLRVKDIYGLEAIYLNRGKYADFRVFQVGGYPAVHANESAKAESMGNCGSWVGVSEKTSFSVIVHVQEGNPDYATSCRVTGRVAELVIQNLKAAK